MLDEDIEDLKEERDIDGLTEYLKVGSIKERNESARALGILGAKEAVLDLRSALEDAESTVRANAALALGHIGTELEDVEGKDKVINALKEASQDDTWEVRHDTAIAMGELGSKGFEEELKELLEDDVLEVRRKAVEAVGKIDGKENVDILKKYIEESELQEEVAKALKQINREETIEPLKQLLEEGEKDVRETVTEAFKEMEPKSEEIMEILIKGTKDTSWRVREEAAEALREPHDEKLEERIDRLLELLDDEKSFVVEASLRSLGELSHELVKETIVTDEEKDHPLEIVEGIRTVVTHEEPSVRATAIEALGKAATEDSLYYILEALENEKNPRVMWAVPDALSNFDGSSLARFEKLTESLILPGLKETILAVGLGKAGSHEKEVISMITEGLEDDRWKVRQKAVESLRDMDLNEVSKKNDRKLMRRLRDKLKDNDKWVRAEASEVLGEKIKELGDRIDTSSEEESLKKRAEIESDEDVKEALQRALKKLDMAEG